MEDKMHTMTEWFWLIQSDNVLSSLHSRLCFTSLEDTAESMVLPQCPTLSSHYGNRKGGVLPSA